MSREMDEYDREWMREYLELSDEETADILARTVKILDEAFNSVTDAQDVADTIQAFEKAKADAWKER